MCSRRSQPADHCPAFVQRRSDHLRQTTPAPPTLYPTLHTSHSTPRLHQQQPAPTTPRTNNSPHQQHPAPTTPRTNNILRASHLQGPVRVREAPRCLRWILHIRSDQRDGRRLARQAGSFFWGDPAAVAYEHSPRESRSSQSHPTSFALLRQIDKSFCDKELDGILPKPDVLSVWPLIDCRTSLPLAAIRCSSGICSQHHSQCEVRAD